MKFIEMTGSELSEIVTEHELTLADLEATGVNDHAIVRINQQGDIEVRRTDRWDVVGGLIGNFSERIQKKLGRNWA